MNDRDEPLYYAEDGKVWKRPVEKTIGNGQRAVTLGFPICTMHEACEGQEAGLAELLNRAEQVPLLLRALEEIRERMNAVANVAGNAGTQNTPAEGTSPAACRLDSGRTESATSEKMDVTAGETAPFSAREEQYRKALEEAKAKARIEALEEAAKIAESQDRAGREWVHNSLWDNIIKRVPDQIRAHAKALSSLPTAQVK